MIEAIKDALGISNFSVNLEISQAPSSTASNILGIYDHNKRKIIIYPYPIDGYVHVGAGLHEALHWLYHSDVNDFILKEVQEGLVDALTMSLLCKRFRKEFEYFSKEIYQSTARLTLSLLIYLIYEGDSTMIREVLKQWDNHELIKGISREIQERDYQCYPSTPTCTYYAVEILSKLKSISLDVLSQLDPLLFCQ